MTRVYNQTGKYIHCQNCSKKFYTMGNAKYCWECKDLARLASQRKYKQKWHQ